VSTSGAASRIRPVRDEDLPAIRDIYNHYVRETTITFDEEETDLAYWAHKRELLASSGLPFLVAVDDEHAVLGYALMHPWNPKSAYRFSAEDSIYLAPDATGRGLGTALLETLLQVSAEAGLRTIVALIEPTAAAASIALHRRYGFADAGLLRDVGVKFGRSLDVVLLQKSLA
jgi:L-amino acid N-acyltransferase YncA